MSEYDKISPNYKKALMSKMQDVAPYWKLLGMEPVDIKKGWAQVRLPFSKNITQADGPAHGGAIFSVADSAVALALLGMINRNETITTIEMKINYLKPFIKGEIIAEARIVQKGSKIALGDIDIWNSETNLIAKCLATYMILKK